MSFNFTYYNRIKKKICILYVGYNSDYMVLLHLLKPQIDKTLSIDINLCYREEFGCWSNDFIPYSKFDKLMFSYVIELVMDAANPVHPIYKLLVESRIPISKIPTYDNPRTQVGLICPQGMWPTQSLSQTQVNKAKDWVRSKRLKPYVVGLDGVNSDLTFDVKISNSDKPRIIDMTGLVVGVESDLLFYAAGKGIPTALVSTGYGTELYTNMFQTTKILNI
jgi:hypothetical protein